jgi:hypothetical protein
MQWVRGGLLEASLPTGAFDLVSAQCPALPRTSSNNAERLLHRRRLLGSWVGLGLCGGGALLQTLLRGWIDRRKQAGSKAWVRPPVPLPRAPNRVGHVLPDVPWLPLEVPRCPENPAVNWPKRSTPRVWWAPCGWSRGFKSPLGHSCRPRNAGPLTISGRWVEAMSYRMSYPATVARQRLTRWKGHAMARIKWRPRADGGTS